MDNFYYIIIITILFYIILLYGGINYTRKIEYDSNYFNNLKKIIIYKKKIEKYDLDINYNSDNFIEISKFEEISDVLVPNIINIFFIKVHPNEFFNIKKIYNSDSNALMIIFNYNDHGDIKLLIDIIDSEGYFYKISNRITITNIYSIMNFSNDTAKLCIFFIKKPFWYY